MINPEDVVRSGPSQYICKEGVLHNLSNYLTTFKFPIVVTGIKSYQAFLDYVKLPQQLPIIQHTGYSSDRAVQEIADKAAQADVIIGIGGGKILDTAKAVANQLNIEVITIPTVVGTCAASTPLSVIYDEHGSFLRIDYHKRSSYLTLVDPAFLLSSPVDYFKSGVGDTLAKWYEAEAVIRNTENNDKLSIMVHVGLQHASFIKEILLKESKLAIQCLETNVLTPSFTNVLEAVITLAGTVGGYAGRYGRIAGAHAVHNGLSLIEETHVILHGQKVAYGIIIQLILENRVEEVKSLLPLYKELGFPTNLSQLGINRHFEQAIRTISVHVAKPEESLQLMGNYTEQDVAKAIEIVEKLSIQ